MGYVTNSAILPVLIGKGSLIISDSLNNNSIVMVHEDLEQKFTFSSTTAYIYLDEAHSIGAIGKTGRGAQKFARVRENSNFFRLELQKMGFEVLGDNDSPVMPIMLYNPAKIVAFSRKCLKENVAVVIVAFPATPLLLGRARICLSTSHTKEEPVKALEVISQVGDLVGIKFFGAEPKKQQQEEKMLKLE
ncbi:long chain base biosynthesis protein 2b-like [Quercus robur]|uniref:long chain base biosynthesis protein 2b-like n=1 Tax=Quercus robur TaxID=38942 RepID=UPI002161478F|nr:long chain base biosynthesis protein 2b-like [Quercus robur]